MKFSGALPADHGSSAFMTAPLRTDRLDAGAGPVPPVPAAAGSAPTPAGFPSPAATSSAEDETYWQRPTQS